MTPFRLIAAVALVCAAAYLLAWPVAIDPVAWAPAPTPGLTGPFAHSKGFTDLRPLEVGEGPEAVTPGPDGFLYTGLQDGWIVRFRADGRGPVARVAQTGGRPLGMQFDGQGHLIVADAFRGLLSVAPDRTITPLVEAVDGRRLLFPNALAITADGAVWFSDASQRFDQHHWRLDFWEGRATGRLLLYDPRTRQTAVRLEDLRFANGVALGPDDTFVLVNETLAARVHRLWLQGPRRGPVTSFSTGCRATRIISRITATASSGWRWRRPASRPWTGWPGIHGSGRCSSGCRRASPTCGRRPGPGSWAWTSTGRCGTTCARPPAGTRTSRVCRKSTGCCGSAACSGAPSGGRRRPQGRTP